MALDDATLSELQAKNGEVYELTVGEHTIYIKKPRRPQYVAWKSDANDDRKRPYAGENLLRSCCVYPDTKELAALLEEWPFLTEVFAGKLLEIAGAVQQAEAKKLLAFFAKPKKRCGLRANVCAPTAAAKRARKPTWARCSRRSITPLRVHARRRACEHAQLGARAAR